MARAKLKADQLRDYPNDPTKFLSGQVDTDGSNKWLTPAGTGVTPQDYPNISGEFLDSYDDSTGLFTSSVPSGGGGSSFPFTVVQECAAQSTGGNATSFVVTFPQALAGSGNTAFMLVACDGSSAVTAPTGWTTDINQAQATYSRFMLMHKATAGETSATITVASASTFAVFFFELSGSHSLDQSSTGGVANAFNVVLPAITPTAGSVVFGMVACTSSGVTVQQAPPINPDWQPIPVNFAETNGCRELLGVMSRVAATNVSTTPPSISISGGLFASGGMAYATFSIL